MNRVIQYFLLGLFPLYPFWAALSYTYVHKPIGFVVALILIPIVIYLTVIQRIKLPKYLVFLILFTIYHLSSTFITGALPPKTNLVFFFLSDANVYACLIFLVVESVKFDDSFIHKLNRMIFVLVIITFIVSVIQIRFPYFFISPALSGNLGGMMFLEERRCFSVWSWINLNSLGISFPILIGILLSVFNSKKKIIPITIVIGIVVSFLSKARYVMISTIMVLSQLFFDSKIALRKKINTLILLACIFIILIAAAGVYGFDIQQVIDNRILEKETGMGSAKARIISYEVFKMKFPENPWFGVGPETKADVVRLLEGVAPLIHVGYLSYLYYYGIFGSLLLFLVLFFILKRAWSIGQKHDFWASLYGILTFCFANMTFVYFTFGEVGMVLAIVYLKYYSDKATPVAVEEKVNLVLK